MQPNIEQKLANWEITAMGLRCDYIDDFVTVRVKRDWLGECVWYRKYKSNASEEHKQKLGAAIKEKMNKCVGPDCPTVKKYRDKLIEEESGKR